jgi:hypothetical protein
LEALHGAGDMNEGGARVPFTNGEQDVPAGRKAHRGEDEHELREVALGGTREGTRRNSKLVDERASHVQADSERGQQERARDPARGVHAYGPAAIVSQLVHPNEIIPRPARGRSRPDRKREPGLAEGGTRRGGGRMREPPVAAGRYGWGLMVPPRRPPAIAPWRLYLPAPNL